MKLLMAGMQSSCIYKLYLILSLAQAWDPLVPLMLTKYACNINLLV